MMLMEITEILSGCLWTKFRAVNDSTGWRYSTNNDSYIVPRKKGQTTLSEIFQCLWTLTLKAFFLHNTSYSSLLYVMTISQRIKAREFPWLHPLLNRSENPDKIAFSYQGDQRGGSQVNWKNTKIWISLQLLSPLFLKYAYTIDILIHQYVHTKFSDGTLPIPLNFWKTILSMNLIWLHSSFLQSNGFSKV